LIWFTRSKVKVTSVTLVIKIKNVLAHYFENYGIYHRAFMFHMLIRNEDNMTCIGLGFTRSKVMVTMVLFLENKS